MKSIGILLLASGGILFLLGLLFFFSDKIPWLGNLPGDFHVKGKNFQLHIPLMSCILISLLLTLLVNLILRFMGK